MYSWNIKYDIKSNDFKMINKTNKNPRLDVKHWFVNQICILENC